MFCTRVSSYRSMILLASGLFEVWSCMSSLHWSVVILMSTLVIAVIVRNPGFQLTNANSCHAKRCSIDNLECYEIAQGWSYCPQFCPLSVNSCRHAHWPYNMITVTDNLDIEFNSNNPNKWLKFIWYTYGYHGNIIIQMNN